MSYDQTHKQISGQTNRDYYFIYMYSRLLILTPAVYAHLIHFTGKLNFRNKVDLLKSESQNHAMNLPVALPSSPFKI